MKVKLNGSELANFICDNVKNSFGDAVTLPSEYLGKNESGWTITGKVIHDYYSWINSFEATKGRQWIKGDFEDEIQASSMSALKDFLKHHPPEFWDYGDI